MRKQSSPPDNSLLSVLSGKTALVYLYIASVRSKSVGIRDIQRAMHFGSPSSVAHHIDKLIDAGIIAQNAEGKYAVVRRIPSGILNDFVFVRGSLIPKRLFYALTATLMCGIFVGVLGNYLSSWVVLLALLPGLASAVMYWYEAALLWKFRNTFK